MLSLNHFVVNGNEKNISHRNRIRREKIHRQQQETNLIERIQYFEFVRLNSTENHAQEIIAIEI